MITNLRQRFLLSSVVAILMAVVPAVLHAQHDCVGSDNINQSLPELDRCISFDLNLSTTSWDGGGGSGDLGVSLNTISGCNSTVGTYNIVVNVYDNNLNFLTSASSYNQSNPSGVGWNWSTSTSAHDVVVTYSIYGTTTEDHSYSFYGSLGTTYCS